MGRRRRRIEITMILMVFYSYMVASLAFKQLFTKDNCEHKKSDQHMEKYGRRLITEGRHGYTNVIPMRTSGGGRGGSGSGGKRRRGDDRGGSGSGGGGGSSGGGGGSGSGGGGDSSGGGGGSGGDSSGRGRVRNSGTGKHHENYMRFIVGGVSISIAYLCVLI